MKTILLIVTLFMATQLSAQQPEIMTLWPTGAPHSNGLKEVPDDATLTIYHPVQPNGMAIIMCPGGGYAHLAMNHEGYDLAPWFNTQGITYIVLKYRMPNGHHEVPLSDAEQAIRLVRQHAQAWNIRPNRVGIMGASAGGHLAASLATLYSSSETRPDFQILLYPVISMLLQVTHAGSRQNLLGDCPSQELEWKYSIERGVSPQSPPAFIVLSGDDGAVPPINGIGYYLALREQKVPATLHVYPTGGHGWGFRDSFTYKRQWTGELEKWLRDGLTFTE